MVKETNKENMPEETRGDNNGLENGRKEYDGDPKSRSGDESNFGERTIGIWIPTAKEGWIMANEEERTRIKSEIWSGATIETYSMEKKRMGEEIMKRWLFREKNYRKKEIGKEMEEELENMAEDGIIRIEKDRIKWVVVRRKKGRNKIHVGAHYRWNGRRKSRAAVPGPKIVTIIQQRKEEVGFKEHNGALWWIKDSEVRTALEEGSIVEIGGREYKEDKDYWERRKKEKTKVQYAQWRTVEEQPRIGTLSRGKPMSISLSFSQNPHNVPNW